jgi:hypothetical protein
MMLLQRHATINGCVELHSRSLVSHIGCWRSHFLPSVCRLLALPLLVLCRGYTSNIITIMYYGAPLSTAWQVRCSCSPTSRFPPPTGGMHHTNWQPHRGHPLFKEPAWLVISQHMHVAHAGYVL